MVSKVLVLFFILGFAPVFCAQAEEIPLRDFFRNPVIGKMQISPDGKNLSYLKPWESRMNLFVKDRASGEEKRLTSIKDRDISEYSWKENSTILYSKDFGGDENFHVFSVDIKTGAEKDLTPITKTRASILDTLDQKSATDVLITWNKKNPELFDVYRVNVKTGASKLVAENFGGVSNWLTDHNGKVRIAAKNDGVNISYYFRATEAAKWKKFLTTNYKDSFSPEIFSFDNKRLFATSNIGRDKESLVEFDPAQAKEVRILYQHPEYDVSGLSFSKKDKKLLSADFITDKLEHSFFDSALEQVYLKMKAHFPNTEVRPMSMDRSETLYILREFSDRSLGAWYFYDTKTDSLEKLESVAPWLEGKNLAPMKPVSYISRDGLKISGYLTLPVGKEAKDLPVVINPHGGPWARDSWGFNPTNQFLANRGYAVLQMNFRGSTGYGKRFLEASFKEWGGTMQNDITDGVEMLIKQGIADKKKICIYGGSYGGYATLAGVAFTPDLYACAIDYVGVANLFTFMKTIPPYWKPMLEKMYAMVGDPEKDKELFTARSPVFHADKIKTPLLVVQGAKDPRVNKGESDQMVEALRKRGVTVEYLVKENEGHGFRNEENRFEFYDTMEKFLKKYLN